MIKVAITGNIAAGKSTVENCLVQHGYKTIDTDKICHKLLEKPEIIAHVLSEFGPEVIQYNIQIPAQSPRICRKKLGDIVFSNQFEKTKLENILHPQVQIAINDFFQENISEQITFISIPLLYEAGFVQLFDKVILVFADDEIRLNRIVARDALSMKEAQKRLDSQISQQDKLELADYVLYNNGEFQDLALLEIIQKCLSC